MQFHEIIVENVRKHPLSLVLYGFLTVDLLVKIC